MLKAGAHGGVSKRVRVRLWTVVTVLLSAAATLPLPSESNAVYPYIDLVWADP